MANNTGWRPPQMVLGGGMSAADIAQQQALQVQAQQFNTLQDKRNMRRVQDLERDIISEQMRRIESDMTSPPAKPAPTHHDISDPAYWRGRLEFD